MSFDYARAAATADRLIKNFGLSATLKHAAPAVYDPATGKKTPAWAPEGCIACVIGAERSLVDGTLIPAGHRVALLSPIGIQEPKPGDVLQWQGSDLPVAVCKPLAPAGVPVLFEVQVRG